MPTPSFALDVQRGSIPGAPNATELSGELIPKRLDDSNPNSKIVNEIQPRVTRMMFGGAHPARVLVTPNAFASHEFFWSKGNQEECCGEGVATTREPRTLPRIAVAISPSEIPASNGSSNGSKINLFQPLRLSGQVKILSHCFGAALRDARKEAEVLHRI